MEFLDPELARYAENHTQPENEVLARLNRETHTKVLKPRMLSGHLQGRVLAMFSQMIRPKRILEIGTYTGYAALCLAEGLTDDGQLHTIDNNEELEDMTRQYFMEAGYEEQIHFHLGEAREIIPTLDQPWNLVFIDADKENYALYYDLVIDKMPSGSYLIADNVLWSGKVLHEAQIKDKDTRALQAFNKKIQTDERVENVLFPVRDGLMVCRKR